MRAPDVDLESERVLAWTGLDHPLQWRIGDETAVPVELAVNFDGREAGRKSPASHHMLRPDEVGGVVEIDKVAGADIDGADAEARLTGVDAVKVDKALERRPEKLRVIKARGLQRAGGAEPGVKLAGDEEPGCAGERGGDRAQLAKEAACQVAFWEQGIGSDRPVRQRIGSDALPEGPELRDPLVRRALPAMMAALIAPIEMPATQSGSISASASAA